MHNLRFLMQRFLIPCLEVFPSFCFMLLWSVYSYIYFEFQHPTAHYLNISNIFILTYQLLSFYKFSSLDLWSSGTTETCDAHSITELTGSTTTWPACSAQWSFSLHHHVSGKLSLWFLVPYVCLILIFQPKHLFSNLFKIIPVLFWGGRYREKGTVLMPYPRTTPTIIWLLNILNMVMSATAFFFQSQALKLPQPPFKSSVKRPWFWQIWLPQKCF